MAAVARADEEVFFAERVGRFVRKDLTGLMIVDFRLGVGRSVADFRPRDFARYAVEAVGIVQTGGRVDEPLNHAWCPTAVNITFELFGIARASVSTSGHVD